MSIIEKGNMDVEMAIDIVHNIDRYEEAIFITGDSDFYALVKHLKSRGKKVYVMPSRNSVSKELREGSDAYMDLKDIPGIWKKQLKRRGFSE